MIFCHGMVVSVTVRGASDFGPSSRCITCLSVDSRTKKRINSDRKDLFVSGKKALGGENSEKGKKPNSEKEPSEAKRKNDFK